MQLVMMTFTGTIYCAQSIGTMVVMIKVPHYYIGDLCASRGWVLDRVDPKTGQGVYVLTPVVFRLFFGCFTPLAVSPVSLSARLSVFQRKSGSPCRYVNGTFGSYDDMQLDAQGQSASASATVAFFGLILPFSLATALLAGYANIRYEQHLANIYLEIRTEMEEPSADDDNGPGDATA